MRSLLFVLFISIIIAHDARATTWDEPWHDEVMRNSESFVKVKALLTPFMEKGDYHVQISACRAVSRIDSPASRELLMKFIEGKGVGFAKVMCVWGLKRLNAKEMIPRLEAYLKTGAEEKTGFGGDIMDPRVGTYFPESVKESIQELLRDWRKAGV